jgi:hypothetical protein
LGAAAAEAERNYRRARDDEAVDQELFGQYEDE